MTLTASGLIDLALSNPVNAPTPAPRIGARLK